VPTGLQSSGNRYNIIPSTTPIFCCLVDGFNQKNTGATQTTHLLSFPDTTASATSLARYNGPNYKALGRHPHRGTPSSQSNVTSYPHLTRYGNGRLYILQLSSPHPRNPGRIATRNGSQYPIRNTVSSRSNWRRPPSDKPSPGNRNTACRHVIVKHQHPRPSQHKPLTIAGSRNETWEYKPPLASELNIVNGRIEYPSTRSHRHRPGILLAFGQPSIPPIIVRGHTNNFGQDRFSHQHHR